MWYRKKINRKKRRHCEDKNCKHYCKHESAEKATKIRNFYFYYSSSNEQPMGFAQNENIYLYNADIYDCHMKRRKQTDCGLADMNKHRVSFYTGKMRFFGCLT